TATSLFPHCVCHASQTWRSITTEQQSLVLVKRLLAISVSCITYMRGLFPESSYGTRYLDDLCLKILREDKSCLGSFETKTRLR
uniref:HORMA domain-containing protein n=1 Tax=Serinus canaria TaxID=9135 RepID=A0A8C9MEH7_SERCA